MKNLTSNELKEELKEYVYNMADELVLGLRKKRNTDKYVINEKLCIK